MTSYSEGPLIPQKVTRSPREPGSQECETLRYSTRTSPAGALRPSTAGCRSFRQGYLQADPLFADRARLESRPGSHPPELLLLGAARALKVSVSCESIDDRRTHPRGLDSDFSEKPCVPPLCVQAETAPGGGRSAA